MGQPRNGSTTTTFAFATIFLLVAMALVATAFATNHWQEIYVDREALRGFGVNPSDMYDGVYWTRFRGLFRTCYPEDAGCELSCFYAFRPGTFLKLFLVKLGWSYLRVNIRVTEIRNKTRRPQFSRSR